MPPAESGRKPVGPLGPRLSTLPQGHACSAAGGLEFGFLSDLFQRCKREKGWPQGLWEAPPAHSCPPLGPRGAGAQPSWVPPGRQPSVTRDVCGGRGHVSAVRPRDLTRGSVVS